MNRKSPDKPKDGVLGAPDDTATGALKAGPRESTDSYLPSWYQRSLRFQFEGHRGKLMNALTFKCSAALALAVCLPGMAMAAPFGTCSKETLVGRYVLTASGFTRAPNSVPGTPWVPKAIVEVLQFDGKGSFATPTVVVANPFGDSGAVVHPPMGAAGEYSVNADCTGSVHFFDAINVTFFLFVELPGHTVQMLQTNPSNNVFQGTAERVGTVSRGH